jgi:hypothetical protein
MIDNSNLLAVELVVPQVLIVQFKIVAYKSDNKINK